MTEPRKPGRPRIHASPTDRAEAARQRRKKAGGGTVLVTLSPEGMAALHASAPERQRSAYIERLILDAANAGGR
jgi:hypothetical protein